MFLDIIIWVSSDILLRRLESVIQSSGRTQVLHGYPGKGGGSFQGFCGYFTPQHVRSCVPSTKECSNAMGCTI